MENELITKGHKAKKASVFLRTVSTEMKNNVLLKAAGMLENQQQQILRENNKDMQEAGKNGIKGAFLDRLLLTEDRISGMANGLREIAALDDPVGVVSQMEKRPNGLTIGKQSVPMGVIGIIYESRPNVTVDAFGLCLKAGSATILRGGKEAIHSNLAIQEILHKALENESFPNACVQVIENTSRNSALEMMRLNEYLDLLIPRGGAGLIQSVVQNSTVPVIETGVGNCHVYIDKEADLEKAVAITVNAKTHRPGVCNAAESLLVHKNIAPEFLPLIGKALAAEKVEIRGDKPVLAFIPEALPAKETDWGTEYLDLIISAKVVDTLDEAIKHIDTYGTGHSEAIVTENYTDAMRFLNEVDAAAVYVNASTRFTDGYEFGFGAEIGISTQKLHARGPMGLKELTSTKYIIFGDGQIRK